MLTSPILVRSSTATTGLSLPQGKSAPQLGREKRGVMAFGSKPTHHHTSGCPFGSSQMNTSTKPWTLHLCTLDMTRLPRRHINSGNPKMFFDKREFENKIEASRRCFCYGVPPS